MHPVKSKILQAAISTFSKPHIQKRFLQARKKKYFQLVKRSNE